MKSVTIELKLTEDSDVYSDATQEGLVEAVKTFEAVLDARVVGVQEGPDPEPVPGPEADQVEATPEG